MSRGARLHVPADVRLARWADPAWAASLPRDEAFYLLASDPGGGAGSRVVIFDGDDTLWKDEELYVKARERIVRWLRARAAPAVPDDVLSDELAAMCVAAVQQGGYGYRPFLTAVNEFWGRVTERCGRHEDMPLELERSIVRDFTETTPAVAEDSAPVLTLLAERGDHPVLYTLGQVDQQLRKVAMTGLASLFRAICVVRFKTEATLARLIGELRRRGYPANVTVVGDSYGRDIVPALALGLDARLLARADWRGFPDPGDRAATGPVIQSLWELV